MNIKELAEGLGLEEEEYLELVELLIESGNADLEKLESAVQEGNAEEAARAAHSLKGASSNLGFTEFSEAAKEIEEKGHGGVLEGAAELVQALKEKLNQIAELARR